MRKTILMLLVAVGLTMTLVGCGKEKAPEWEYKVLRVEGFAAGKYKADYPEFDSRIINVDEKTLNKLGSDGWELVGTYTEVATTYPNFGRSEYVTGIRTNTHSRAVICIFKRLAPAM